MLSRGKKKNQTKEAVVLILQRKGSLRQFLNHLARSCFGWGVNSESGSGRVMQQFHLSKCSLGLKSFLDVIHFHLKAKTGYRCAEKRGFGKS